MKMWKLLEKLKRFFRRRPERITMVKQTSQPDYYDDIMSPQNCLFTDDSSGEFYQCVGVPSRRDSNGEWTLRAELRHAPHANTMIMNGVIKRVPLYTEMGTLAWFSERGWSRV